MTSSSKVRANRINARSSTGPKSAVGRRRASQNAHRHGLNIPVHLDPVLAQDVQILAMQLRQGLQTPGLLEAAYAIAEAVIDLKRIRKLKRGLLYRLNRSWRFVNRSERRGKPNSNLAVIERFEAGDDSALLEQMKRVDRYERRALARRKSAIQRFTSSIHPSATCPKTGKTKPKKPTIPKGV